MYVIILLSIVFTFPLFSNSHTLKDRLLKGKGGEFIVTQQDKTLTLLTHHRLPSGNRILFQEISVPRSFISFPVHWQEWINSYAPGHHSWTLYEIDSQTGELISCFSPSKGQWLSIDSEAAFLPKLLKLPLQKMSDLKKKRIGPAPLQKSEDHRRIWSPLLVYEGKTREKAYFDVYEAFWPSDHTDLSLAEITLYFEPSFPFPYWMQVDNGIVRRTVRVIDSGSGLQSLFKEMPKRNYTRSKGAME